MSNMQIACHVCQKPTAPLISGKYRNHADLRDPRLSCPASGTIIPGTTLPGVEEYVNQLASASPGDEWSWLDGPQKQKSKAKDDIIPMSLLGNQVASTLKEIFRAYGNRRTSDNRSAQATLGPSEIGTPCDRRLAMSLLRVGRVNPGGDGWAAFIGTAVHVALAEMLEWANAGTGRFATEVPLTFDSPHVPKGTTDVIDRTMFMVDDHKVMGYWSLNKLRTKGLTPQQRTQLHVYGLGARRKGEKVDYVAIVAWPREKSDLEDLYVYVEPYDPAIAVAALERVDRIADHVNNGGDYRSLPMADDCRYCPHHLANAPADREGVCNGKS